MWVPLRDETYTHRERTYLCDFFKSCFQHFLSLGFWLIILKGGWEEITCEKSSQLIAKQKICSWEKCKAMNVDIPPHTHTHKESSSGTVCDAICPAWGDTEALFSVPFHSLEIYTINRAKKLWNILWWNIKEMRKSPLKLQFNQCKRAANTVK